MKNKTFMIRIIHIFSTYIVNWNFIKKLEYSKKKVISSRSLGTCALLTQVYYKSKTILLTTCGLCDYFVPFVCQKYGLSNVNNCFFLYYGFVEKGVVSIQKLR